MHLAQANVAFFRWPLDDPRMEGFANQIDTMNKLAESSDGFIWRYTGIYDPTGRESPFDNPLLFFNLSVWRDIESLRSYVFQSEHVQMLRRKSDWVQPTGTPPLAIWWLAANATMPTVDDAIAKFKTLERDANSPRVLTSANTEGHRDQ